MKAARRFVFCHVPRSAGTTIAATFSNLFGRDASVTQTDPRDRKFLRFLINNSTDPIFASGHISLPQALRIKKKCADLAVVSSLRDPVDHALSLYLHNKYFIDPRICSDRRNTIELDDLVLNYDPNKLFDANVFNVFTRVFSGRARGELSESDLDYATKNARDTDFFFNADSLKEDFNTFCAKFDLPEPVIPFLNTNPFHDRSAINENTLQMIEDLQRFDIRLFQRLREQGACVGSRSSAPRPSKPFVLAEAIRRSKYVAYAPNGFFRFEQNSIVLHPTKDFKSTLVCSIDVPMGPARLLDGRLRLPSESRGSVKFRIVLESGFWSNIFERTVGAGQDVSISISVPATEDKIRITLETEIWPAGSSCDYASAMFSDLSFVDELRSAGLR